jgi:hypothetical protein
MRKTLVTIGEKIKRGMETVIGVCIKVHKALDQTWGMAEKSEKWYFKQIISKNK